MHFRVTAVGRVTGNVYNDQFRSQDEAEDMFNAYTAENRRFRDYITWESVTLSTWVDGVAFWSIVKSESFTQPTTIQPPTGDWHNSPVTHSYA